MLYPLFRAIAFRLNPEWVHEATLAALRVTQGARRVPVPSGRAVDCMGLTFPNPVGLAAGLDKNGVAIDGLGALGFGFLEVGTVTPRPQPGNAKPRLFRLPEHRAIINRMGFNNLGAAALVRQVQHRRYQGILGINIGKNFDTPIEEANRDYLLGLSEVYAQADYVAVNISSPNTSNLRELQKDEALASLLGALAAERERLAHQHGKRVPIAVKIAPDLTEAQLDAIASLVPAHGMDALIATNTTLDRSAVTGHRRASESGGLSGAPVRARSTEVLRGLRQRLPTGFPLIGVGGIFCADDAREKLDAGANLVQVYTGLIYRGPGLVRELLRAL